MALDGSRRIVWMIKAHPTENRMARRARGIQRRVFNAITAVQTWQHQARGGTTSSPLPRTSLREVDVETWDAIRSRRNVRSYGEQAIAPQDLDGSWKPHGAHPRPATSRRGTSSSAPTGSSSPSWPGYGRPPATSPVPRPRSRWWRRDPTTPQMRDLVQFDLGQATMSIMLAAADLGIGSAHAGVGDQETARRLLGFPEDRFCPLLIALGPRRPPAHADPAAQPPPIRRRGAPRPLVAAAPT
jgi:Nitroreductase family